MLARRRGSPSASVVSMAGPAAVAAVAAVLVLCCCVGDASAKAVITEVLPYQGSRMGGTRITVHGYGFARDGLEGTTRVFIGPDECEVVEVRAQSACPRPGAA